MDGHIQRQTVDEAAEDTLSFRDLPLQNSNKITSRFGEGESSDDYPFREEEEEENFEFSSPEWSGSSSTSSSTQSAQNIVFFGKLIPIRQAITASTNKLYSNHKEHTTSTNRAQVKKREIGSGSPVNNMKRNHSMFMFGLTAARVPKEMVLTDIKNRQSRQKSPRRLFTSDTSDSKKKGFWGSLMFWSCARLDNQGIYDYDHE